MVNIDKSGVKAEYRNAPFRNDLESFVEQVSLLKPLCEFKAEENSVSINHNYEEVDDGKGGTKMERNNKAEIYYVNVYQDGERLGGLSVTERYSRGNKEWVYGVESFRISKERGNPESTYTKNIKVALRTVKKVFVNRQNEELIGLIKGQVDNQLRDLERQAYSYIKYDVNTEDEVMGYVLSAYKARKAGIDTVTLPAIPQSVASKLEKHEKLCNEWDEANDLVEHKKSGKGYAVSIFSNGSLAIYSYATQTLKKYKELEEVPQAIREKVAMFKVINQDEPYSNLGCKFRGDMLFIVERDTTTQ